MDGTSIPAASGARRPTIALDRQHVRSLTARILPATALDDGAIGAAFELFRQVYDGADRVRFERDLAEKQRVIVLLDAAGRLRGFSTVLLQEVDTTRGRATVVFSGDTVIDPAYWGQKRLQGAFARLLLELKLAHPLRPLFWFLISKGYRTYLLLANAFPRAVPRCDRVADAAMVRMRDALATARFGGDYDSSRGVVCHATPHERVREGLAPITGDLLDNPHIRFFAERNPGHVDGEELVCLAEVRLADLARIAARMARHRLTLSWTGAAGDLAR